jgi:hypothetical protein
MPLTASSVSSDHPPAFSPGPFQTSEHQRGYTTLHDPLGRVVATLPQPTDSDQRLGSPYNRETARANARLFRAAPQLHEGCRRALAWLTAEPRGAGSPQRDELAVLLRLALGDVEGPAACGAAQAAES